MNTPKNTDKTTLDDEATSELYDANCYADNLIASIYSDHVRIQSQFSKDEWFIKISAEVELWEYPLFGKGEPTLNATFNTVKEAYKEGVIL